MKNLKLLSKVILTLLVVAFICGISTVNMAETPAPTNDIGDIVGTIPQVSATPSPRSTPTPTPSTTPIGNLSNNKTTNTTNTTSLPKTGANDTGMWVLIGACVVAAVYTYKKVRDYNV